MLLHQHDVFHENFCVIGENAQDAAFFAFVASGDDADGIVVPDVDSNVFSDYCFHLVPIPTSNLGAARQILRCAQDDVKNLNNFWRQRDYF